MDISCLISRTAAVRSRMPGGVRGTLSDERSYLDKHNFMAITYSTNCLGELIHFH